VILFVVNAYLSILKSISPAANGANGFSEKVVLNRLVLSTRKSFLVVGNMVGGFILNLALCNLF
jgi:hypothetical protein